MTGEPTRARQRLLVALVALGLSVVVAVPAGWLLSRPEPQAGATLQEVLADPRGGVEQSRQPSPAAAETGTTSRGAPGEAPADATAPAATTSADSPYPPVTVRDAGLEALATPAPPAPVSVIVPDLGITADVQGVGVQDDGSMVIPASVSTVGWYRYGPAPGSPAGNAVLAGHVDTAEQGLGAFARLREVEVGSRVTVVDQSGRELHYDVVGKETITKEALPVEDVFARDGEHVLVLVTCGGPFQPDLRSYRDNVVVTAVPVARP